ncbi:hypothetical protein [Streptomyces sp. NPDC054849]
MVAATTPSGPAFRRHIARGDCPSRGRQGPPNAGLLNSDRGKIRSRRVTRVAAQQQLALAIENAGEMALLP